MVFVKLISSIVLFSLLTIFLLTISVIYGLFATLIAGSIFGVLFGLAAIVFSLLTGGLFSGAAVPIDVAMIFVFGVLMVVLIGLLIFSTAIFFINPIPAAGLGNHAKGKRSKQDLEEIGALVTEVSSALGVKGFSQITPVSGYYVGVISSFGRTCLLCDPRLIRILSDREFSAILAHELGHFQKGNSVTYSFLRRCHLSSKFMASQTTDKQGNSSFQKLSRWLINALPDFFGIHKVLSAIFFHISGNIIWAYGISTKLVVRLFRSEMYRAEIFADKVAADFSGRHHLMSALVALAICQLFASRKSIPREIDLKTSLNKLLSRNTTTHPSIELRLEALDSSTSDTEGLKSSSVLAEIYPKLLSFREEEEKDDFEPSSQDRFAANILSVY